jgi:hypothetical protein
MKTEVNITKPKIDKPFPKLMKYLDDERGFGYDLIVLMYNKNGDGVCLSTKHSNFGRLSGNSGWFVECFEDFEGSVTLSNDQ